MGIISCSYRGTSHISLQCVDGKVILGKKGVEYQRNQRKIEEKIKK